MSELRSGHLNFLDFIFLNYSIYLFFFFLKERARYFYFWGICLLTKIKCDDDDDDEIGLVGYCIRLLQVSISFDEHGADNTEDHS